MIILGACTQCINFPELPTSPMSRLSLPLQPERAFQLSPGCYLARLPDGTSALTGTGVIRDVSKASKKCWFQVQRGAFHPLQPASQQALWVRSFSGIPQAWGWAEGAGVSHHFQPRLFAHSSKNHEAMCLVSMS